MSVYEKIESLGIQLPKAPVPVASYVVAKRVGNIVYASGQTGTMNGKLQHKGKLGENITIGEAQDSAQIAILNCLAAIESVIGDLRAVAEVVKLTGFVASANGFDQQPIVVEGASKILLALFGDKGKHTRSAIGVAELPYGAPVEVELIVRIN